MSLHLPHGTLRPPHARGAALPGSQGEQVAPLRVTRLRDRRKTLCQVCRGSFLQGLIFGFIALMVILLAVALPWSSQDLVATYAPPPLSETQVGQDAPRSQPQLAQAAEASVSESKPASLSVRR